MSYSDSSEYIGLTKVKNPDDIGVKLVWNKDIKPSKFKEFITSTLVPTVDSSELLQRKSIPESLYKKLLDPSLEPIGGTEETKDNKEDSDNGETKDDANKNGPLDPKKEGTRGCQVLCQARLHPYLDGGRCESASWNDTP